MVQARNARIEAAGLFGPDQETVRLNDIASKMSDNLFDYEEIKRKPASPENNHDDGPVGFNSFSDAVEWWKFSQKDSPKKKVSFASAACESVYQ